MSDEPTFSHASSYRRWHHNGVNPLLVLLPALCVFIGLGTGWALFHSTKKEDPNLKKDTTKVEPVVPTAEEKGMSKDSESGPAGTSYVLKCRAKRKGDKCAITETVINVEGKGEQAKRLQETYEFSEEIDEVGSATNAPTKFTHNYKVARMTRDGHGTDLPYAGKTVQFYRSHHPRILLDGVETSEYEVPELVPLLRPTGFGYRDILPTRPVKLNQLWKDPRAVKKFMKDKPLLAADYDRSEFTGKLVKVYIKDRVRWGVIEASMHVVCKGVAVGTISRKWTWEMCIDGVHRNENVTTRGTSDLLVSGVPIYMEGINKMTVQELK